MSQRHRSDEVLLPPKQELRAHAHGERHRIQVELNQVANEVSAGTDPADVHEPGTGWKPVHHHDAEVAKTKLAKQSRVRRHWKTKMWKRRSNVRRAKAEAFRPALDD